MTVLDIDLDFFVSRAIFAYTEMPPEAHETEAWGIGEVDWFLKHCCMLANPVPGRIVKNHQDVYYLLKSGVQQKVSEPPHTWVHIDSHSDLGFGTPISHLASSKATCSEEDTVDSNNFLFMLLHDGYINELHSVYNATSLGDIDADVLSTNGRELIVGSSIDNRTVRFHRYVEEEFTWEAGFDFIFLALSPEYVPSNSAVVAQFIATRFIIDGSGAYANLQHLEVD